MFLAFQPDLPVNWKLLRLIFIVANFKVTHCSYDEPLLHASQKKTKQNTYTHTHAPLCAAILKTRRDILFIGPETLLPDPARRKHNMFL